MKKLMNLKGAVSLNKTQQKNVNGGSGPVIQACNGNCSGLPTGTRCYHQGHCGCPGRCSSGTCIPY
ncbi:hypothetical protein [uncultured Dokdonia sp.]|uniref:hypothetical protein n=1 Tax=uncultured Dokdonia sp. TaxID=575653 RepID=UPI0026259432|nr:hypothetical protein [uncultured Dokdonia sp.]